MKGRNYRKGLKPLKKLPLFWLWMPVVYCLLLLSCYLAFGYSLPNDLGSIVALLHFHYFYTFIVAPIMSILYCRIIGNMGWIKYLCCIYNAVIMGSYFTIYLVFRNISKGYIETLSELIETIVLSVKEMPYFSVFIPALICGLITLIVYDVTKIVYGAKKRKT